MKYDPIDLSSLPFPDVIDVVNYEDLYDQLCATFLQIWGNMRVVNAALPEINVLNLETDPVAVAIQAWAHHIMMTRIRVNDVALALMLATAGGTDLDNFSVDFNLKRLVIGQDEDGNSIYESDDDFRKRRQLAPAGYAAAGPYDAYKFFALSADGLIKEVEAIKGEGNRCDVILLGRYGDGAVSQETIQRVYDALSPKKTRPLTDNLYVRGASIQHQQVRVQISVGTGPDASAAAMKAKKSIEAYAISRSSIGKVLRRTGLIAAAYDGNALETAEVLLPLEDVDPGPFGSVHVSDVIVEVIP